MNKQLILVLILLSLGFSASASKSEGIDVVHYEIRLDVLDFATRIIHGQATITFTPTNSSISDLSFELRQLGVDSVFFGEQQISSFSHSGDNLLITLPQQLSPGDTAAVTVFYHGVPYNESWGGFHYTGEYAFNLGVGFTTYPPSLGKAWFPCVDNFFDRALFDYHIRVTDNKKAVCGGLLQSVTDHGDGTHTFHWKTEFTIPTYLASVAIGDYVGVTDTFSGMERDIPITIYVRPIDTGKVAGTFSNIHTIIANLENRFGPYPFERIGYTATALGAMEHAGNVAYPNSVIDNSSTYEWLYTHEISHMWFGNKVTCSGPGEMWLNEGWAVWTELLYREDLYDQQAALAVQRSKHKNVLHFAHTPSGDGAYYALHNIPGAYVYGETVYQKGGLVVQTLRHYLGDGLFFPAIQYYLDTFAYHHASSYDLRDALSQHSGVDLTAFFDSWVFQPGFPHYSIDSFNISEQGTEVFVRQRSKGRDFIGDRNIVEITFMDQNRQIHTDTLMFDGATGSKIFQVPFEPVIAMMDYHEKICDATTDRSRLITEPGTYDFTDTFSKLIVSEAPDTAFVRITHNWVAPDPLQNPPPGLTLSDYRHWHVDGIIPEGFQTEMHLFYQRTGFLDNNLIISQADSLVILYRPTTADEWQSVPFSRIGPWSIGWIVLDTLRTGEYTLAVWDAMYVGLKGKDIPAKSKLICFPNPASDVVSFIWEDPNAQKIRITNINGKIIDTLYTTGHDTGLSWDTRKLKPGVYFATLFSAHGEPIDTVKVLLNPGD